MTENEKLASKSAAEVIAVLEKEINGTPSVRVVNYKNAHRLITAALMAVFNANTKNQDKK